MSTGQDQSSRGLDATFRLLDRPLGAKELQENTADIALPLSDAVERRDLVLVFQIGEEVLALPAGAVARVHRVVNIHRIPHRTSKIMRGLCNIEGQLVLCASLAELLQIVQDGPQKETDDVGQAARMIVIGNVPGQWAFAVGTVHGVVGLDRDAVHPPPMTVGQAMVHYTDGILNLDGRQVTLIKIERLLAGFEAALR